MLATLRDACAARRRSYSRRRSLPATDLILAGVLILALLSLAIAMLSAAALIWTPAGA